jgi:hypothetical protein
MTEPFLATSDGAGPEEDGVPAIVTLTRFANPLEAQVLHGLLVSEGIGATLGDYHHVQTNTLWATALGGVRVMVPAAHLERAHALLAAMQSGALALDGDPDPALPPPVVATDTALWSPDLAAFFSIWLTPLFGALLHLANAHALREQGLVVRARAWLLVCSLATAGAFWLLREREWTMGRPFEASTILLPFTAVWYFMAAHAQSRHVGRRFGVRYVHRSLLHAVAVGFVALLALGSAGTMIAGG